MGETKPKNQSNNNNLYCNGIVIHLPDVVGDDVDGNGYSDEIGDDGDGDVDCCGVVVDDIDDNDDDDVDDVGGGGVVDEGLDDDADEEVDNRVSVV